MAIFRKKQSGQREIRAGLVMRPTVLRRLIGQAEPLSVGLAVLGVLLICMVSAPGVSPFGYRVGQTLQRAVPARVDFELPDEPRTALLRMRASEQSPNHYVLDDSLLEEIRGRFMSTLALAKAQPDDREAVARGARENKLVFDEAALLAWMQFSQQASESRLDERIERVLRGLAAGRLVEASAQASRRPAAFAVLVSAGQEPARAQIEVSRLRFSANEEAVREVASVAVQSLPPELRDSIRDGLVEILRNSGESAGFKPLYRFSPELTNRAAEEAVSAVSPQRVAFGVGTLLADAGVLDEKEIGLLRSEQAAADAIMLATPRGWKAVWGEFLGRCAFVTVVGFGLIGYLLRFQKEAMTEPLKVVASLALVLSVLLLARQLSLTGASPFLVVGVHALAAAMFSIVYGRGVVVAICSTLAMLLTLVVRQDVGFLIVLISVSGVFGLYLSEVRYRGKIVGVGLLASGAALGIALAAGVAARQTFWFALHDALWAGGATLLAAFIVEGLLPAVERLFRFSTSMTLLEWCDATQPLLRILVSEAPGTYNHSLIVGNLAENAATAIGANGLLCRAGGLYHDIGKINKPEYFIENQGPGESRHSSLSPTMSHLIIIGHVKDGLELARKYKLPAALRPFIAEHHGTTLVEYFYHAANKQRKPGERAVDEVQYRYPGPKPQSRETAIVMLCDGVEGAVRSMTDPTPMRIEGLVNEIAQKRLVDGQFDECDLSFRELAVVERSLARSLSSLYHARIAYPSQVRDRSESGSSSAEASESRSAS